MPQWIVQSVYAIVLCALLASAGMSWRVVRRDWNISSTYILILSWALSLPTAFVQFTGGLESYIGALGNLVVIPSARAGRIAEITTVIVIALSAILVLRGLLQRARVNFAPLLGAMLVVLVDISGAIAGVSEPASPRIVALVGIFLAATVLPRGRGAVIGIASFGITFSAASCLLALLNYDVAFKYCRSDKCGPLGNLFFGASNGENVLSLLLVATIPALFLAFAGKSRWVVTFAVGLLVFLSGSRTSLAAVLLLMLILLLLKPNYTKGLTGFRAGLAGTTLVGGVLVGAVLPLLPLSADSFTNRAYLWSLAKADISREWLLGYGGLHWGEKVGVSVLTRDQAYSVHNQLLDIVYTGGVLGLLVFVVMVAVAVRSAPRSQRSVAWILLMPVFLTGWLERSWAFGLLDVWGWLAAATFLAVPTLPRANESPPSGNLSAQHSQTVDWLTTTHAKRGS